MATTFTIEAHPVETMTGLWCDVCCNFSLTVVRCSIVDAETLAHQRYATGSLCAACGHYDD